MSLGEAVLDILKAVLGLLFCTLYLIIFVPPAIIMLPFRIAWDDAEEIHDYLSTKMGKMLDMLFH